MEERLFSKDAVMQYFQERDAFYKEYGYDILLERQRFLEWLESIPSPILELGSGKGYFTALLSRISEEVIALDIDREAIAFARAFLEAYGRPDRVRFICSQAESLPLPDASINCVVSFNAWHHIDQPDIILSEIKRVLAPGAILAIVDFTNEGFRVIDEVHRRIYGTSHPAKDISFEVVKEFFRDFPSFEYNSKYQKGIYLRLA